MTDHILKDLTPEQIHVLALAAERLAKRKKDSRKAARLLREAIIGAWNGRCSGCHTPATSVLEVHHADPVHENGGSDPRYMYPLCPNCHSYVHALRRTRGKSVKRLAVENEMFQVYEGDVEIIDFLRGIAETESTKEKIQKAVQQRAAEDQQ